MRRTGSACPWPSCAGHYGELTKVEIPMDLMVSILSCLKAIMTNCLMWRYPWTSQCASACVAVASEITAFDLNLVKFFEAKPRYLIQCLCFVRQGLHCPQNLQYLALFLNVQIQGGINLLKEILFAAHLSVTWLPANFVVSKRSLHAHRTIHRPSLLLE